MLQAGTVVFVGGAASLQFASDRGFDVRVIRVTGWDAYRGWVWLEGYVLNAAGAAVARRSVFVMAAGLQPVGATAGGDHGSA